MIRTSLVAALSALAHIATAPALACPGPFAESYLIWFDQPALQPREIALEIEMKDFVDSKQTRDRNLPVYKIARVLAGAYPDQTIEVKRGGSNCQHEIAAGSTTRLVLVGRLVKTIDGRPLLLPRYMPYADPIRIEGRRALDAAHAEKPMPADAGPAQRN